MNIHIHNIPSRIRIEPKLPASKSISNRLLMISALSEGKLNVQNLSDSDDTSTMLRLLSSKEKTKDAFG